ncbi:hypothetical protein FHT72_006983 [Rhizobium sp. BK077]|uniref:hypothetical protein n=1 Tax=unclassified Rhizobium TaxID=2613769 RepID=UPI001614B833|nr:MULTISPECIES: hypothetical protein [unclassified Rhizobium]MBB3303293.1 hypothetical protein [Rhizobium sp. BK112]MBB3372444.1 hypothetical protein [Rhizobium sp. BK077]MBB4183151.1 hypothetical protein [Rhizobium sp. BK109]
MHGFRNDLDHLGLQYESILSDLSRFYFSTACRFLASFKISWFDYSSNKVLPDRAMKFFLQGGKHFEARPEDFRNACELWMWHVARQGDYDRQPRRPHGAGSQRSQHLP